MLLLLFILINAFAALFSGLVGFGQGLVVSPLSLAILDKGTVLTALMVAGLVLNATLIPKVKEPLNMRVFKPLLITCLLGMPLGIVVLKLLPLDTLRIVVGALSIILTSLMVFVKFKVHHLRKLTPVAGLLCGVLQTSTGMPGPPVLLLLAGSDMSKQAIRKLLFCFFFWISVLSLPLFWATGVFTLRGALYGLIAVPFVIIAGRIGNRLAEYVPHRWYRAIILVTIGLSGAYAIASGLMH
jgi:uncharacterized protein